MKESQDINQGMKSDSVQYGLVRAVYPAPQLLVRVKPNKRTRHTVTITDVLDFVPHPCLDFIHQLSVSYFWVDAYGNEVVRRSVEDLDFHKRRLRIGRRYRGAVGVTRRCRVRLGSEGGRRRGGRVMVGSRLGYVWWRLRRVTVRV